jgi:hypothetical protein
MRNYDIIKQVLSIACEEDGTPTWSRYQSKEQIQKIKELIAEHRPTLVPKDQRRGLK